MSPSLSSFAHSAHTLPRNFTFHYQDGELPKTPEPSDVFPQRTSPPPPPTARAAREPYRLRRRRAPLHAAQRAIRAIHRDDLHEPVQSHEDQDTPLPSIELTDSAGVSAELNTTSIAARLFSPPKTPVAQIYGPVQPHRDASSSQEDVTRPSTACSDCSNSSKASSIESFPSFGESCSPKSQNDPFIAHDNGVRALSSPLREYGLSAAPVFQSSRKSAFTQEMDEHLWLTYMRYLQDPTHTPFKMLPGTAPPPGVCSRVVREAKRTWKGHLTASVPKVLRFARWGSARAGSPEALAVGSQDRRSHVPWPRSDSATRKRLRELCKRKPQLSAHYGRLLHARSPSPFMTSSVGDRSTSVARDFASPRPTANTFSTRDMNISLATSVSTTMQPDHPLVQLGSEVEAPPQISTPLPQIIQPISTPQPQPPSSHYGFTYMPRTPGHQKSFSMQESALSTHPRPLASPFRPLPPKPNTADPSRIPQPSQGATAAALAPPVELHAPVPQRALFKRPAQNELNDMMSSEDPLTRQSQLMQELFGAHRPREIQSHRRVRSRGFSLGDMSAASRLESLFSADAPPMVEGSTSTSMASTSHLLPPPSIDSVARLGSPFAEKGPRTHFNTFPRNFSLGGLEPAMEVSEEAVEEADQRPAMRTYNSDFI